jgi:hypothetical protein
MPGRQTHTHPHEPHCRSCPHSNHGRNGSGNVLGTGDPRACTWQGITPDAAGVPRATHHRCHPPTRHIIMSNSRHSVHGRGANQCPCSLSARTGDRTTPVSTTPVRTWPPRTMHRGYVGQLGVGQPLWQAHDRDGEARHKVAAQPGPAATPTAHTQHARTETERLCWRSQSSKATRADERHAGHQW